MRLIEAALVELVLAIISSRYSLIPFDISVIHLIQAFGTRDVDVDAINAKEKALFELRTLFPSHRSTPF